MVQKLCVFKVGRFQASSMGEGDAILVCTRNRCGGNLRYRHRRVFVLPSSSSARYTTPLVRVHTNMAASLAAKNAENRSSLNTHNF